jgi:DNA-binding GntR family transcriptional regulator
LNAFTVMKALAPPIAALAMAFLSSSAIAETTEERQACIGDAFRVCWSAIPNRDQVFHCLLDNRSRLNPACRVVMDQYRRPHRLTRSMRAARVE